jgi:hypothetical protein
MNETDKNGGGLFKQCSMCLKIWKDLDAFLDDVSLELNGYEADFDQLEFGLLYFTHRVAGCFSTMALEVRDFFSLYSGKRYPESKKGEEGCTGKCLDRKDFELCPAHCRFAYVREVVQVIKRRQRYCQDSGLHQIMLDDQDKAAQEK